MALITCPECGKKISSKASFCVNCGCPAKEWKSDLTYAEIGDVIEFGSYFRTKYKQKLPIEWIVLNRQAVSNEASKLLLVSKYALDCKPYNKRDEGITWEESALRTWLNGDFYDSAFNAQEQSAIALTDVLADVNPRNNTDSGNDTTDKVFLLSIDDAEKYFASDKDRKCAPTEYAIAQGALTSEVYWVDGKYVYTQSGGSSDIYWVDGKPTCCWWLRSPGASSICAASVCSDGSVSHLGDYVDYGGSAIRPAMWIMHEA
jgi:hypothetical protein